MVLCKAVLLNVTTALCVCFDFNETRLEVGDKWQVLEENYHISTVSKAYDLVSKWCLIGQGHILHYGSKQTARQPDRKRVENNLVPFHHSKFSFCCY